MKTTALSELRKEFQVISNGTDEKMRERLLPQADTSIDGENDEKSSGVALGMPNCSDSS